ncbi:MAG: phosphoglucomutase/phosphomannomutase family protein [Candidatus Melainabacteria bacterium]|nr:phosphoglucomutase/phosphomannomutase family protein [Candidatus Melainabacteria bacterium]
MTNNTKSIKFGTDGWRAIIADGFTFNNVRIASHAIGKYVLNNCNRDLPILIGFDPRFLADKFARSCANELISLGLNVEVVSNVVPTPVIAFWAAKSPKKTNGAIQFTASHNPPEYCGLKYITSYGGPAPVEITNEITKYIRAENLDMKGEENNTSIPTFAPKEGYVTHLKKLIDFSKIKNANLKIVYDPMFGAGNNYLDYILKEAGCETVTIHNKKDPLFGGLLPEPKEEFLNELKKCVTENKANMGLATDGDADRISAVDRDGMFYSPNKIASMLLRHLVKNKKLKGKVVRTLSTTHLMDHLAKKYNLELIETQVGFKWICEKMLKESVLIGAEESGGISIINHIPDKDAILAGMLLTEMLAFENKTLGEIYKDTLNDANWNCINDKFDLHMDEKQKEILISRLQSANIQKFGDLQIESINKIEGAKYLLKDGSWFLARASGTEPMARVYFEATSEKSLKLMKSEIQRIVESIL